MKSTYFTDTDINNFDKGISVSTHALNDFDFQNYANALVESYTGFPAYKHSGISPEDMGW